MQLFGGCKTSFHTLLRGIGFKWFKDNPRRGVMELPDITLKIIEFLTAHNKIKEDKLFDFLNLGYFKMGHLQDCDKISVKTIKIDGKLYIVIYAGNKNGIIPGVELVFSSKSKNDYHVKMNHNMFLLRFENQLLKNLEEPSVIIMDNAPYHCTLVETILIASTKAAMKEWLSKHALSFEKTMLKTISYCYWK
ncbi:uncharacterized protein LOC143194375 isoform X2 [Rhynchophorus ferrugineus]|uniref:uncharacterized protein LOC143194375 isoform X2 n=1 Tax=Rhynchophorus ferrugineus TaxID=354439 RepID=UPI003FCEC187